MLLLLIFARLLLLKKTIKRRIIMFKDKIILPQSEVI